MVKLNQTKRMVSKLDNEKSRLVLLAPKAPKRIEISNIVIGERRRPLDEKKVAQFESSIRDQGFLQPIHVYPLHGMMKDKFKLVAGRHRLQGLLNLGHKHVMAIIIRPEQAAAWESAENLFRNDLSEFQRSVEIVKYAESRTHLDAVHNGKAKLGGKQPHDRGISELAKATGIDRKRIADAYMHVQLPKAVKRLILSRPELDKRKVLNAICIMADEAAQIAFAKGKPISSRADGDHADASSSARKKIENTDGFKKLRAAWIGSDVDKIFKKQPPDIRRGFLAACLRG